MRAAVSRRTSARRRAEAACALLLAIVTPRTAHAGNDDELLVGNRAAMTAGAVAATVADGSATWYDPAGLGGVVRNRIDVSGTVYTLRLYSTDDFLGVQGGESEGTSVVEFISVPNQITYVRELARGVSLGLGYFVPKASSFRLREQLDVGDAGDGSQWQIVLGITDVQHTAAAAVGLALSPRVRVGFSLIGTYETIAQSVSFVGLVRSAGAVDAQRSTAGLVTIDRIGGELGAGVQADLGPRLHGALFARGPRLLFYDGLDATFSETHAMRGADGQLELQTELAEPSDGGARADLLRAGRLGLGLAWDYAPGSYLSLEADVQPGLHDSRAGVTRKAVVNARVGVLHALSTVLALGAGLFTDRSPDVREQDAINAYGDFYGATLGLELSNEHRLARGEPAESLVFSTMFALRYGFSSSDLNAVVSDPDAPIDEWFQARRSTLTAHEIGFYVGSGLQF